MTGDRMDLDTYLGQRRFLLDQLEAAQAEAEPDPSVLWLDPSTGVVYDRPEGGEPVDLRPAAVDEQGNIIYTDGGEIQ